MILDAALFDKTKKQLAKFASLLDSSTKLLFAQNIVNSQTSSGESLIDSLYDIFEKQLLDVLELSQATKDLIEGKQ